ncbi:hypothetical protein YC2023_053924 [Brassica napus]
MQNPWFGKNVICRESADAESSEAFKDGTKERNSAAGRSPSPERREKSASVSATVSVTESPWEKRMQGFGS